MPINVGVVKNSGTPGPVFIFDPINTAGGSPDATATMTTVSVGGVTTTVNAALEIQSTTGGLLIPRMTGAQRDAMTTAGIVDGMIIYKSDAPAAFQLRTGSAWVNIESSGGVFLAADGTALLPSYAFLSQPNTGMYHSGANAIDFSTNGTRQVQIGNTATAVDYITLTGGATGAPGVVTISAASAVDANITIKTASKGTGAIDFFTGTVSSRQFSITDTASAVNYLSVTGSTGTAPISLFVTGTGANIGVNITTKGDGSAAGTGGVWLTGDGVNGSTLRFYNVANTFFTGLQSANPGANFVYALPLTAPVSLSAFAELVPLTANSVGQMVFSNTSPRYAQFSLSSAQIKAMFGAPFNLIATPGVGQAIIVTSVLIEMEFSGAAYTAGGNIYLQYGAAAGSNFASSKFDVSLIVNAASTLGFGTGPISSAAAGIIPTANAHNQGLYISNDGGAFATGSGTLEVSILYYVVETA